MSRLRLATRSSPQARTQAEIVAGHLGAATGLEVELVFVDTMGDQRQDVPLHTIGGQGVFVKEVQRAVLAGDADLAVHSAKDLPSQPADGLTLAAFCERRNPHDALIGRALDDLPEGATVATGSVRRRAQLAAVRPDLSFVELRGNIHTRLGKLPEGGSLVMAMAALEILGLTDLVAQQCALDVMVPAVGQGCVAVECRTDDRATLEALAAIDHATSRAAVEVERAFLAELGSGCSLPVGAHASDGVLRAFLGADDPARRAPAIDTVALTGDREHDLDLARSTARRLRSAITEA